MGGLRRNPTFPEDLPQTKAAVAYARRRHAGQVQGDGTPYLSHPLEVASLLHEAGAPDHLIAAGVVHDLIEKAGVSEHTLRSRFGSRICELVLAVSDDERIGGYAARKAALRRKVAGAGNEALLLFAADKLSKLRELRRETELDHEPGGSPRPTRALRARRLRHYQRSLAMLQERLPDAPLVSQLRDELRGFVQDRSSLTTSG